MKNCINCRQLTICKTRPQLYQVLVQSGMFKLKNLESIFNRVATNCMKFKPAKVKSMPPPEGGQKPC